MPKGRGAKGSLLGGALETGREMEQSHKHSQSQQESVDTEIGKSVNTENGTERDVSLTIKVPIALRRHWQIEAKRRNRTVTSFIVEALTEKLGSPQD